VIVLKPNDAGVADGPDHAWPRLSANDRFDRVVEASPTALVLTEHGGRIRLVNHQAERLFGYDRVELQDKPLELLIPERFREQHFDLRQRFLSNMSAPMTGEGWELFGLRKDGTEFPLEIGLNPIDIDGESMVLAGIIDVTARRKIEQEKIHQQHELERSNADLEEFAYAASHDLKAPLRAIGHLAEWIGEDIAAIASPDALANLNLLQGRVARLQMLLDGLLAYSRIGRIETAVEDVDIAEVVRDVVGMLELPSGFVVTCEGEMTVIRTHRMPIQIILKNLITNALQHHDRSEGRVTVTMRLVNEVPEIRVSDDGPGIPKQFHDRIFVIFQTLARRDDVESGGVGLAIVKKKVQANGGRIWVESAPPVRGATFVCTWKETAR
jgi:PAS domain S-box-containing protein